MKPRAKAATKQPRRGYVVVFRATGKPYGFCATRVVP